MQIVYLSNRPQILCDTLRHVAMFMPFIEQAVVCTPDSLEPLVLTSEVSFPLLQVTESEILSADEVASLDKLDHQSRNYLLRARLVAHPSIEARFIMSDDDARPLKPILKEQFIENNRFHHYYFHDLIRWNHVLTDFDRGQVFTGVILTHEGMFHRSYASHMPQMIDQEIYLESVNYFAKYSFEYPLCEWSCYFNFLATKHPQKIHEARSYETLCWPENPLAWRAEVEPTKFSFENYTPLCYQKGQVFEGVNEARSLLESEDVAVRKIVLWKIDTIRKLRPEERKDIWKYLNWRTWVNKLFKHLSQY